MNTNESKTNYTLVELMQYQAFEKVRSSGAFNMFDPRARHAAKLTPEQYAFVMDNYSDLKKQHEEDNK
jgi:hypothetical protein